MRGVWRSRKRTKALLKDSNGERPTKRRKKEEKKRIADRRARIGVQSPSGNQRKERGKILWRVVPGNKRVGHVRYGERMGKPTGKRSVTV